MNRFFLILSFIISTLFSCTKVIDIDIDEKEKKIVVNSIFCSDSIINVQVSKSLGILEDNANVQYINNAEVRIVQNGSPLEMLSDNLFGMYHSENIAQSGKSYNIEVTVPGYSTVTATTNLPSPVPIISIDTALTVSFLYNQYIKNLNCNIRFQDPSGADNYYALAISNETIDTFGYSNKNYVWYSGSDPFIDNEATWGELPNNGYGTIFPDALFDGNQFIFKITIDEYNLYTGTNNLIFYLYSLPQELYRYLISFNLYQNARFDPFAEPVQVYSNSSNGFGIFTGYSISCDTVLFEKTWNTNEGW
ncbi:MAG: DUF4249 domain-containing protein [Bacteroidia bacterium]|nr:DUF4249 domain-containing protein [Bacteroidia bacterium]